MVRRFVLVVVSFGIAMGAFAAPALADTSTVSPDGVPLCCHN